MAWKRGSVTSRRLLTSGGSSGSPPPLLAFRYALAVRRCSQFMFHQRIHGQDTHLSRKLDILVLKTAAVELSAAPEWPKTAAYWSMMPHGMPTNSGFCALPQPRDFERFHLAAAEQRKSRGNLECRRRAETGAGRHVARNIKIAGSWRTGGRTSSRATPTT